MKEDKDEPMQPKVPSASPSKESVIPPPRKLTSLEKLQKVPYDLMDVGAKEFEDDYFQFRARVKEFDRQLGRVLIEG